MYLTTLQTRCNHLTDASIHPLPKKLTEVDDVTSSKVGKAVVRLEKLMIPGEACLRWPFLRPVITKAQVHIWALARCKSPILRVSCQCKLRRHQMFFSPPTAFLLRLFQMAVCREEKPQRVPPLVRADARGTSVQKYLSHKQLEQGFSHALRLTALCAVYNNLG